MVMSLYPTTVIKMAAHDMDVGRNAEMTFSISSTLFVEDESGKEWIETDAFTVDGATGVISTSKENYLQYINGHFRLDITVSDAKQRRDTTELYVSLYQSEISRLMYWPI